MKAFAISSQELKNAISKLLPKVYGCVVAGNIPNFEKGSGYLWRKGHFIKPDEADLTGKFDILARSAPAHFSLHLLQLEEGDITEDEAGIRLARLVGGSGVSFSEPDESRVNLRAKQRGLLKIDTARLEELNEVFGVAVFTIYNDQPVLEGTEVCGCKVTPLVYPVQYFEQINKLCAGSPIVDVLPFQKRKIAVVYREAMLPKVRARFEQTVMKKLEWFGAEVLGVTMALDQSEDLTKKLDEYQAKEADLILHVGGNSSDPLDPIFEVIRTNDIKMERHGAPAHPGTLFWLAYRDKTAIFGLASCGMFSKTTLGDLFLAKFCAGENITSREIAKMGHGGLFTREMAFRFPQYGKRKEE
jgi:hypothetical protein